MPKKNNKIVIFLAFANDRDNSLRYLRNLPDEARRLREVLETAEKADLCEVVIRSNCTADDIFKVFQDPQYRNRIAIFHYGGHANGYQLLLESANGEAVAANAGGLSAFLAQQQGMQLVFLNGCSTREQTQGLLDANIASVISTSRSIDDKVATDFAYHFYRGLAGGATIRTAYNEAEAAVQTSKGDNTREAYVEDPDGSQEQPETDRWPWDLNLREGAESVAQWNLPQAVGDPLFGLPPLPEQDLPESPYRHLNWFTRRDAEVFFGRGHQIRELYDQLTSPGTAPIMLFYGQSGVGKSSLLDAGLLPRMEMDYEVRYLRRTADGLLATLQQSFLCEPSEPVQMQKQQEAGKPVVEFLDEVEEIYAQPKAGTPKVHEQLLYVLKTIFSEPKRYLDQKAEGMLHALRQPFEPPAKDTPIAIAWRQQEEQTGKPLIVILDQVEELYTHPSTIVPDELNQFLQALTTIFADPKRRPKGKLVLGFRKEWLAELEAQLVVFKLPRTKVFLEPLDHRGVMEVVQGPTQSRRLRDRYRLSVDNNLPEAIADDLLEDRDSAVAPTLQILLTKLWSKATEANPDKPNFSQPLYKDLKRAGILMRDFLQQQIEKLRQRFPEVVDSGLLLDMLAAHTTALGTAGQCDLADLQQQYAHQGAGLDTLLQHCQDLQLLTIAAARQSPGNKMTRLAHDTLAPLVRESFEKSDKPGQRTRRVLDSRSVDWADDKTGSPLDEADLAIVERGANGTRVFSSTEQRLVDASREARASLYRNRKRQKIAAIAAVVVILLVGTYGWLKSIEANKAKRETTETIIKFAFQSFDKEEKKCKVSRLVSGDYSDIISDTSGYGLICHVENFVKLRDLQRMSKLKMFLSGPHEVDSEEYPLTSDSNINFGHYNPKFVDWAFNNLIPTAEILATSPVTQAVYDEFIRDQARIFYLVYQDLHVDELVVKNLANEYAQRIESYTGDEFEYDSESPGGYMQDKFGLYSTAALRNALAADTVHDMFEDPEATDKYRWEMYRRYSIAAAYWLRRELDGTASQFFSGVKKVLNAFDPEFLKLSHKSTTPVATARTYLADRWTLDGRAIVLHEDGTYQWEDNSQQGKWQLPELNKLVLDGQDHDPCTLFPESENNWMNACYPPLGTQ